MKKIIIFSLLLLIFTIGSVCAIDDANQTTEETLSHEIPEEEIISVVENEDSKVLEDIDESSSDSSQIIEDEEILSSQSQVDNEQLGDSSEDVLGISLLNRASFYDAVYIDSDRSEVGYFYHIGSNYDLGNLTISIEGVEVYNSKVESYLTIYTNDLSYLPSFGEHNVTYSYSGGDFEPFTFTKKVNFTYHFSFYAHPVTGARNVNIQFYIPDHATGTINLRINNRTYKDIKLNDLKAITFDLDDFNLGYNDLYASYEGDDYYPPSQYSTRFYCTPKFEVTYVVIDDEEGSVQIDIPKHEHGVLNLFVDRQDHEEYIDSVVVENGTAILKIPKLGESNTFLVDFRGSMDYYTYYHVRFVESSPLFNVIVTNTVKQGQNVQIRFINEYDEDAVFNIEVDGKPINNRFKLTHTLDMSIPNLSVGNHTISIRSDDYYSPIHFSKKFNITVLENANETQSAANNTQNLENDSASTSSNTDKPVESNKVANKISLKLSKVKVKKSAKKITLKANLKINGKSAKSKHVVFKFNGKTYKVKTNSKGIAKLTIKKSILKKLKIGKKVKYQVKYSNKTVKKTATVKK